MNMTNDQALVKHFPYSKEVLQELESTLSPERLSTYAQAARSQNPEEAFRLYLWNMALSSGFYGMLQGLEITVRNAMHKQLSARYGRHWYDSQGVGLDSGGLRRVQNAKTELSNKGLKSPSPPRVVAGLSFGFWVSLLGPGGRILSSGTKANYEMTIWRPALHRAFPHARSLHRKKAHTALESLRILRNRIAHHEPILNRQHEADYQLILEVTRWVSPVMSEWLNHHNRVRTLISDPRRTIDIQF